MSNFKSYSSISSIRSTIKPRPPPKASSPIKLIKKKKSENAIDMYQKILLSIKQK